MARLKVLALADERTARLRNETSKVDALEEWLYL